MNGMDCNIERNTNYGIEARNVHQKTATFPILPPPHHKAMLPYDSFKLRFRGTPVPDTVTTILNHRFNKFRETKR